VRWRGTRSRGRDLLPFSSSFLHLGFFVELDLSFQRALPASQKHEERKRIGDRQRSSLGGGRGKARGIRKIYRRERGYSG
jgi:hypothetical protein